MLSGLKEVFEAAEERIKSPILGSIVIAFILMNWKAVYFVVFSGDIALMKFNYFDANTTAKSLLWPIPLGFIAALAVPWVSFIGSFLVELPNRKMKLLQDQSAHKILKEKNKLASERENEKTIYENSLIDQAKRDLEIKNIKDVKIREDLENKVSRSRKDALSNKQKDKASAASEHPLSEFEAALLSDVGRDASGGISVQEYQGEYSIRFGNSSKRLDDRKIYLNVIAAVNELILRGYLGGSVSEAKMTDKGYKHLDSLN